MGKAEPVASILCLRLWKPFRFGLRSIPGHLGFGDGLDVVGREKDRIAFLLVDW